VAIKFSGMKNMTQPYKQEGKTGLIMEAKASFKNPSAGTQQPQFSGKGVLYIDGKTIPLSIGVWENNYGTLNIRGTKAWNKK